MTLCPSRLTVASMVWMGVLAVGAFQVMGTFGAADNQPDRRGVDAVAVALVLLGPLALAWLDRWPLVAVAVALGAADVYVARGYPYGPIFLSVVIALFAGVQRGQRRPIWALAAAGYAGFVVAHVVDPRADGFEAGHLGLVAGWLVGVLAVADVVRNRREQAAADRRRRTDEQRLELAQELHDVLAHNLSLINVQASVALHLLDDQPDRARPALATVKAASHDALRELRTALDVLRRGEAAPRAPAPRLADIPELVHGVRAGGLDVRLEQPSPLPSLPAAVELAAYRIVQEALTNVTRHARARHATVTLAHDDGLTIEVTDDGVGASPPAGGGHGDGNGIVGMQERAAALGGTVTVGPDPGGRGFRVAARLPT